MKLVTVVTLAAALLVPGSPAGAQEGYKVVVHPSNPGASLSRAELGRIFLKKITAWPDKRVIQPVDQERTAPVRQAFSADVHQKDPDAISAHWQVLVYSGRDVPPRIVRSDEDVLAFVRANPGAIGYVSADTPASGVKVVSVK
jgi:ABC-type phosphate transport system substrate-binding protein